MILFYLHNLFFVLKALLKLPPNFQQGQNVSLKEVASWLQHQGRNSNFWILD